MTTTTTQSGWADPATLEKIRQEAASGPKAEEPTTKAMTALDAYITGLAEDLADLGDLRAAIIGDRAKVGVDEGGELAKIGMGVMLVSLIMESKKKRFLDALTAEMKADMIARGHPLPPGM